MKKALLLFFYMFLFSTTGFAIECNNSLPEEQRCSHYENLVTTTLTRLSSKSPSALQNQCTRLKNLNSEIRNWASNNCLGDKIIEYHNRLNRFGISYTNLKPYRLNHGGCYYNPDTRILSTIGRVFCSQGLNPPKRLIEMCENIPYQIVFDNGQLKFIGKTNYSYSNIKTVPLNCNGRIRNKADKLGLERFLDSDCAFTILLHDDKHGDSFECLCKGNKCQATEKKDAPSEQSDKPLNASETEVAP